MRAAMLSLLALRSAAAGSAGLELKGEQATITFGANSDCTLKLDKSGAAARLVSSCPLTHTGAPSPPAAPPHPAGALRRFTPSLAGASFARTDILNHGTTE